MSDIGRTIITGAQREYCQSQGACDVKDCRNAPAVRIAIRVPASDKPLVRSCDAIAYVMVTDRALLGSRPLAVCLDHVEKAKADFGTERYMCYVVSILRLAGKAPAPASACRIETEPLPSSN